MSDFVQQLKAIWEGMEPNRRLLLAGAMIFVVIALVVLVMVVGQPKYEPLYTDLSQVEQDAYIGKLVEMNVPYRKVGSTILTPKPHEVRGRLVDQGFVKGGVLGWTLFDKSSLGSTNFQNNVSYQRALQDEIRRTLQQMQGVMDAQVILTMPINEDVVFADERVDPTASIMLKLSSPNSINQAKVMAITEFVANSVKGMKPENVTVVDNFLNDLTSGMRDKGWMVNGRRLGDHLSARMVFEQEMEKSIESMLNRVLGPNKAVARVHADLNMDYQEIKSEIFGDRGTPRSEQERIETYQGDPASQGGVPGVDSNLTEYRSASGNNPSNHYEKSDRTVNYEINRTEEFRIKAPGEVRRLTVSLFVDGDMTPAQVAQMETSVANAVGLDENRGDRLTVANLPFTRNDPFKDMPNEGNISWDQWIRAGALLAGIALLLVFFFSFMRSVPKPGVAGTSGSRIDTMVGGGVSMAELAAARELSPEERYRNERQESLEQFAKDHPEDLAVLLKAWLAED